MLQSDGLPAEDGTGGFKQWYRPRLQMPMIEGAAEPRQFVGFPRIHTSIKSPEKQITHVKGWQN